MKRCNHCPLADSDRECVAETTRHSRYCELVDPSHPDYSPVYVGFVRDWAMPAIPQGSQASRDVALAAKLKAIEACPHRSDTLKECSCTGRKHCKAQKGSFPSEPWAVSLADCLRCVDAGQST